ncbi:MAG: endonuclease III [Pseudomonadota bacterium]
MNNANINKLFSRLEKQNPNPTTELKYKNPFQLLIAVILSAQATDISVNKATKKLFIKSITPEKILNLGEKGLKEHIKNIGLHNTKAKNIIKTCRILVKQHNGEVPEIRSELESLPGVGRKTANVVLNTAFNKKTIAVDTHIFRVCNRTGLAPGKNVLIVEKKLLKHVPEKFKKNAHHWLILHGRYICSARTPKCPNCLLKDICLYKKKAL